jgi:hypothetical protein
MIVLSDFDVDGRARREMVSISQHALLIRAGYLGAFNFQLQEQM